MDNKIVLYVVIGIILLLLIFGSFGMMGFGLMWIFGWMFMILLLVALVLFIIWLIKQIQKK